MKTDFLKLSPQQAKNATCTLFQGTNEAYINFCLDSFLDGPAEFYTQEEFLERPDIIKNQADLFAPASSSKTIIIRNVSDKSYEEVTDFCKEPQQLNKLILIPVINLKQTKLKTFLTNATNGLIVNCYLNSANDKISFIKMLSQQHKMVFAHDALMYLSEHLEEALDNLKTDIEKIRLYITPRNEISFEDLKQNLSINIAGEVVELVDAIAMRNRFQIQSAIQKAEYNGFDIMMSLRYLSAHFAKLLQLKALIANDITLSEAFMQVKPAIFFKLQDAFKRQINLWQETEILKVLSWLTKAETSLKTGDSLHVIKIKKLLLSLGR